MGRDLDYTPGSAGVAVEVALSMTASDDNMCARNHSKKVLALHAKTGNPVPAPRRGGHHREFIVHSIEY
jgi:hypothetical protein